MWLNEWHRRVAVRPRMSRRAGPRLWLERLEDRTVPSSFSAATVADLVADINAANRQGGANTITLTAPTTLPYLLTAADNSTDGPTGLPVIAANDNLTIIGNGDTIQRSTAAGTPTFRLLDVAAGASLTLQNLTLQGGSAFGAGVSADGGAIYSQGTLDLKGVTVRDNSAKGAAGQSAAGGGIYSSGALTLEGGTLVQNNQAVGGYGSPATALGGLGASGGNGVGGGLYVAGGTAELTGVTVFSNVALGGIGGTGGQGVRGAPGSIWGVATPGGPGGNGGQGGTGGAGLGGGVYVAGGTVQLAGATVSSNAAHGGPGGTGGAGGQGGWSRVRGGPGGNGGQGGTGGDGLGGGMYVATGMASLTTSQ